MCVCILYILQYYIIMLCSCNINLSIFCYFLNCIFLNIITFKFIVIVENVNFYK